MKLSNWLLNKDEEFLSIVKDEHKRKIHLKDLHRFRTVGLSLVCVFAIVAFVGVVLNNGILIGSGIIIFVVQGFTYLDADSKIRNIRLYELLVEK